jgi:hypothetical protein
LLYARTKLGAASEQRSRYPELVSGFTIMFHHNDDISFLCPFSTYLCARLRTLDDVLPVNYLFCGAGWLPRTPQNLTIKSVFMGASLKPGAKSLLTFQYFALPILLSGRQQVVARKLGAGKLGNISHVCWELGANIDE